ncbi:RNA polymerase sigma factor [Arcticibacter sp.]|uniref:RNA polymerase sigma factor n=1 Tax=Arcticibacter sp. TaxID=1872630 RepID=UPI003890FE47
MKHRDELTLLQKIAAGDTAAFTVIYEHYGPPVCSFIKKYMRSQELSDDICQNVFIKIWEQREQLSEVTEFAAWAFTIAKRQCIDLLKRASREQTAMSMILSAYQGESSPSENKIHTSEYLQFIESVLNRMPPRTMEVFRLCRQQCKSYNEAAEELGITRDAIKKHMVRSMRILKESAEKELGVSFSLLLILLNS